METSGAAIIMKSKFEEVVVVGVVAVVVVDVVFLVCIELISKSLDAQFKFGRL